MRMILMCIIFVAIFSIGLVYGINYNQSSSQEVVEEVVLDEVVIVDENIQSGHLAQETSTENTTSYTLASTLEGLFTILAETFIAILYSFSKLFI